MYLPALPKGGYTQDYSILNLAVLEYTSLYLVYNHYRPVVLGRTTVLAQCEAMAFDGFQLSIDGL